MTAVEIFVGPLVLVALHEVAHAAVATAFGYRCVPFARLPWKIGIRVEGATGCRSRLIALAGPAANLLIAAPLIASPWSRLGWLSLLLATLPSLYDWRIVARAASAGAAA